MDNKYLGQQTLSDSTVLVNTSIAIDTIFHGVNTMFEVLEGNLNTDYTLNMGEITFLVAGKYTVTISNSAITSNADAPAKIMQTFHVLPLPAIGISLDKSELTILAGASDQLVATVKPTDADQTVTWSSSDDSVAIVNDNGIVTAVSAGSATITATTEDGRFAATCKVTVIIITGINNVPQTQPLEARMQNEILHVSGLTAGKLWSVYNVLGKLVYQSIANGEQADIPLFASGVYLVQSGGKTVKVVKK